MGLVNANFPDPLIKSKPQFSACGLAFLSHALSFFIMAEALLTVKYKLTNSNIVHNKRCKQILQNYFSVRKALDFLKARGAKFR